MPTQRQRRKRRKRLGGGQSSGATAGDSAVPGRPVKGPSRSARVPTSTRGAHPDDRPPAPWGSFPLSEIVIFVGILLLVAGFIVAPPQGLVMIGVGLALASLAGLELAIREHYAGYRSHNLLLAAAVGVPTLAVLLFATKLPTPACVAGGLLAFGGAAWLFAQAFSRRSGGALYRLKG